MKIGKLLYKFGLLSLLGLFLLYGFWPEPVKVDLYAVKKGALTVSVEEEGKTRVIDRFVISAPITAYLKRINLYVGNDIKSNDILAELEPLSSTILDPRARAEANARVDAARSALKASEQNAEATKADLDYARSEFARMEKLRQSKTISEEQLDQAKRALRRFEAHYRSAVFAVDVARFKLDEAQKTLQYSDEANGNNDLDKHLVKSPVNGKILKIHRKSEGVVKLGEPLLEIGDPKAIEVAVEVLSIDAVKIQPGMSVQFKRWGGDNILEGIVETVEPTGFTKVSALGVEEQRVNVIVNITSPYESWKKLGDGYRVDASFIIWQGDNLLLVPASSLFRKDDRWSVFKVVDNKAQIVPVKVGQSNGLTTEIQEGLKEQDIIIPYPDATVKQGVKVVSR